MGWIELECPRCLYDKADLKQNGPHIEARCQGCGKHVKFVGRKEAARAHQS